jgi:putative exosortase-associated protein (TIGR04073 family)
MRNRRRPSHLITLIALSLLMGTSAAEASLVEEAAPPIRKLGRGLANTFMGVFELPLAIRSIDDTDGPMAGIWLGSLLGVGAAVTRTVVGIAEVLTFPFPMPGTGYGPILRPEFLFQPAAGQGP